MLEKSDSAGGLNISFEVSRPGAKKNFLIVDDDEKIVETFKELVELNWGETIRLLEARDGANGLTKIHNQSFDCIFTELNLPRKGGLPFIRSIRSSNLNQETPIIVITAEDPANFPLHEFDFVESAKKPIDLSEIVGLVEKYNKGTYKEKYLSAYLFNHVLYAIMDLITAITSEEFSSDRELQFKKAPDKVSNDLIFELEIEFGRRANTFAICFNSKQVEDYQKEKEFYTHKTKKEIVSSFAQAVFNSITKNLNTGYQQRHKIKKMSWNSSHLEGKAGLITTLNNPYFEIQIFANTSR